MPIIYANSAGTSYPKPAAVCRAVQEVLVQEPSSLGPRYEQDKAIVAARLGAEPSRLLITSGCTQALSLALLRAPLASGDEVLTSGLEHEAVAAPLAWAAEHRGVMRAQSPYSPGRPFDLEWAEARLKAGRVAGVVVCSASNVTGERLPVAEIAELARAYGVWTLVDAAQTFGLVADTVTQLGCDMLTFAGHKAPLGPQGIGGLWVSEHFSLSGGRASCQIPADGGKAECEAALPGYCDVGSVNMSGLAGLAAGLQAFGTERDSRMTAARTLVATLAERCRQLSGVRVLGHCGAPQTAVLSLVFEDVVLQRAEAFFCERGVIVRAGQHCAPEALKAVGAPAGTVRISFGPDSTAADAEHILSVVASLAAS